MTSARGGLPLRGAVYGLLAAALFGASAPLAKRLLPTTGVLALAGLLYLGAGLSLTLYRGLRRAWTGADARAREAPLRRADYPLLAGVLLLGGMAGPLLMLFGLSRLTGVASALLLNLEAPLTILLAVALFREHLGRREAG